MIVARGPLVALGPVGCPVDYQRATDKKSARPDSYCPRGTWSKRAAEQRP